MQEKPKKRFKWVRWGFKGLITLLLFVVLVGAFFLYGSLPKTSGEVTLLGLKAPVKITRDENGVPHIEAFSDEDAAFAVGFVHGQERLWQLEFHRRVVNGALSEILGEATLRQDRFLRTLGVKKAAKIQYQNLNAKQKEIISAYVTGINAFIAQNNTLPPEFLLTSSKPQNWESEDVLGWFIMMALDLGGNYNSELFRLSLARDFPLDKIHDLLPPYKGEKDIETMNFPQFYKDLGVYKTTKTGDYAPLPAHLFAQSFEHGLEGIGSNNWGVTGARSITGQPLLANDPHLGLTAPAIWFAARIKTPTQDVTGMTFLGSPYVILGRNPHIAWAFTNTNPDVQDLYLEAINPANPQEYRTPTGFTAFQTRVEEIKIKGKPSEKITVRETRHGPDMSQVLEGASQLLDTSRFALSLQWTALMPENQTALASYQLNHAKNVKEAIEALKHFVAPQQSVMIADKEGNLSMVAAGRVPIRAKDHDLKGIAPALGWEAKYDWQGFIPFEELPQEHNPALGFLATANQKIHSDDYKHFISSDFTPPYRQDRIVEMMAKSDKHSFATFKTMHGDVHSEAALKMFPYMEAALKSSQHPQIAQVREMMQGFKGEMAKNSAAPLLLSSFIDFYTQRIVVDKLGARKSVYGSRDFRMTLERILPRQDAFWCDMMDTPQKETCEQTAVIALNQSIDFLKTRFGEDMTKWQWGNAHASLSLHRPLDNVKQLRDYFNISTPTGGDTYTVNVGRLTLAKREDPYRNGHAASLRALYDLSDLDKSVFIYQTGQSGHFLSKHYRDMAQKWGEVEYLPLTLQTPKGDVLHLKPR